MEREQILLGWGKKEITPPQKTLLRGQFYTRIAERTNDPLFATVLAIKTDTKDVIFWVSLDLVATDDETTIKIAAEIAKTVPNFKRDNLICSCIHNHTGPFLRTDCSVSAWGESFRIRQVPEGCMHPCTYRDDFFVPMVAGACIQAYNSLSPAGIAPVLGHAVMAHPRRVIYRDATSVMYGSTNDYNFEELEGCPDNAIEMIYTYDTDKKLTGLVMNVNSPAQVVEHKSYFSADFIGAFRIQLYEKLGYEIPVLAICGNAGNMSPRDLVRIKEVKESKFKPANMNDKQNVFFRGEPDMHEWEGAWELGRRLCNNFEYMRQEADNSIRFEAEYDHKFLYMPLNIRTVSTNEYNLAKEKYQEFLDKYDGDPYEFSADDQYKSSWFAGIVNRGELQKKTTFYDAPIHVMRLGECAFLTNPFELYNQYGMRMIARSLATHIFTAQLTDSSAGYLPTPFAVKAKSYSAMVSNCVVSCDGAEVLTENCIRIMNEMFE